MSDEITSPNTSITRRKFALGLAFASVAGVAAARQPTKSIDLLGDKKLENVIPEKIGRWSFVSNSGLVVPPEDQLARALYSQLLTRTYMDEAGNGIMLLVAQSPTQSGILQIHRPNSVTPPGATNCHRAHRIRWISPAVPSPPSASPRHETGGRSKSSTGLASATTCRPAGDSSGWPWPWTICADTSRRRDGARLDVWRGSASCPCRRR
ncbi:exosortase-associated EpsI family protein [Sphingomonas daechungensis]|uniref:Exosortase-associated EpsI family protein n=1 Tax=Sphingomonas daechungensis TaxID=1176646 RepID=A0ABX6SZV3_9SPHN|nr:exosortase-associated EpsI family protein [Sphingomonas daechungensis]